MQYPATYAVTRLLLGALLTAALGLAAASPAARAAETHGDDVAEVPGDAGAQRGSILGIDIGGGSGQRAEGVEVTGVSPSGPAASAGLRKGDVIVAIDGKSLRKAGDSTAGQQLINHLRGVPPGQEVKLDYLRDGRKASMAVTTVPAESPLIRAMREHLPMLEGMALPQGLEDLFNPGGRGFRALELVPITPKLGQYFGTDKGLLVVKAPAASGPALEEGDVILTIGGRTPENPRHAFRILGSYQPQEKVKIEVLRQRKPLTLEMELPDVGPRPQPSVPAGGKPGVDS